MREIKVFFSFFYRFQEGKLQKNNLQNLSIEKGVKVNFLNSLNNNLQSILNSMISFSSDTYFHFATLERVNITFAQAQLAFLLLCDTDTVLIGHSLENDLKCLRLLHYRCLDTAYSYPHWRGIPWRRKLRELAKEYLQEEIQIHDATNPVQGHDSAHYPVQVCTIRCTNFLPSHPLRTGTARASKSADSTAHVTATRHE